MPRFQARHAATLAVLLAAQTARAEQPRVVVVGPGARDPLTAHVMDELIAIGATVELVADGAADLAVLGRSRTARAAVRIEGRSAALWIDGGSELIRRVEPSSEPGPEGVALRTAELVRANLIAVEERSRPEDRAATTPQAAPSAAVQPDRRLAFDGAPRKPSVSGFAGPGLFAHVGGGMTVGADLAASIGARLTDQFIAELLLSLPLVPSAISAPDGKVSVSGSLVGIGAAVDLLPRVSRGAVSIGAGAAVGFLDYDAEATSSRVRGRDGTVAFGLPYLHAAGAWRVLPPLGLRVDALVGLALPRPVILVAGVPGEARFGQPLVIVAAGPQLELP